MFNIGAGEFALIAVVALLVLGPKRLPELARGIGKFLREFRKQTDDVRNVVEREFYRMDEELQAPPKPPEAAAGGSLPSQTNKASANRTPASTNAPVGPAPSPAPVSPSGAQGQPPGPGVADTVAAGELPAPEPMTSQVLGGLAATEEKK